MNTARRFVFFFFFFFFCEDTTSKSHQLLKSMGKPIGRAGFRVNLDLLSETGHDMML